MLREGNVEDATVKDMEANQVNVHGIGRSSVRLTNSQTSVVLMAGRIGDGLVPILAVEQHEHGVADLVEILVEGNRAGCDRGGLRNAIDGAEGNGNRACIRHVAVRLCRADR